MAESQVVTNILNCVLIFYKKGVSGSSFLRREFSFNMLCFVGQLCILPCYLVVSSHYSKPFKFKLSKHIKAQVRTKSTVLPFVPLSRRVYSLYASQSKWLHLYTFLNWNFSWSSHHTSRYVGAKQQ